MPNPSGYHQHRPSSTQRHQCFALRWPSLQRLLHLVCPLLLLLLLLIGGGERWKRRTIIIGLGAVIGATGTSATPTTKQTATGSNGNGGRLQPIILDESRCPLGWTGAGQQCVQLQFLASRPAQAESECRRMGAQLANVLDADGEPDAPTLEDLADILEEALMAGLPADQSAGWLVSPGPFLPEWDPSSERVRFRLLPKGVEVDRPALGLRMRRGGQQQQEGTSSAEFAQPFVCALSPLWRRMRLYEQQLLPRGGPRLEEQPEASYFFDPSASRTSTTSTADKNKYKNITNNESSYATSGGGSYLSLPCTASGNPTPSVRWFRNGGDEVDLNSSSSHFVVSTGTLLVPLWLLPASPPATFHCVATNRWGSVRSRTATIRPAFIEPFRESRLDAFPLISGASKGGGARLECQAPRHFPRSFSFSWVRGDSYEKFVEVSPRIFISMDGTLYFAYNVREDEDSYACTLTSAATQSAQHGPFFRLLLPLGHINPKLLPRLSSGGGGGGKPAAAKHHPHAFAPRIDEFQPQLFPSEVPARGQTAYLECFAYGFPVPTYRWTRVDGQPLPSGRHKLLSFGRILRIDSLELADSGRYRCSVQNELGTASAELRLSVQAPPSLFRSLIDRLASPGSSASFQCHLAAESSGAVQVEWFRDGVPLAPLLLPDQDRDRFKLGGNELTILDLRQSDSAIYQCLASNDVGSVSSSALLLVSALPPRFHANVMPARLFVVEGSPLSMPCLFQSSPPAKARWMRLGEDGERGGERHAQLAPMLLDQSVPGAEIALLSLDSAQLVDSGVYECTAQNGLGTAKAIVWLEVLARPQMSIRTGEEDAASPTRKFTCELEINCRSAEECPEALFSWEFNDRPIRSLASANMARENGRRLFRLRQREQQQLKRRGPRESSAELLLVSQQQSQLELPAQFTNEHVGRFACNSLFGGATVELEPQLAFVPLKLSVQQVDESGGARLVYRTVELLGSAANGVEKIKRRGFGADEAKAQQQQKKRIYELEARTGAERRWRPIRRVELAATAVGSGGNNNNNGWPGEIQLDGLEPNQRYQFRLRPAGDRVQAVSLSDWIHTPQTVPSQPVRDLRFRMLDDRHVLLEWEPVERAHQSAPDLRYNVSWTLPGGRGAFAELVDSPRLVIPLPEKQGPEECLVLEVGVRPVNRKGPGQVATEMVVRASGKEPQRFAAGLRLQTVNATHLNLSWHWEGEDPCENVVGAKIMCVEEAIDRLRHMREAGQSMEEEGEEEEADRQRRPNWTTNSSNISGNGTIVSREVTQSVPADYGQWLVHSLLPQREYVCRVVAFDQYGRTGPMRAEANARAWTAERAPERAPEISFVLVKESADTASGGYAVLLDWRAVALAANDSAADSSTTTMEKARLRGYKLFVYVSETAEQPIVLTLTEAELHDPLRPSARIDGLKPMFFYGIQVAAFNPGGLGPLSERIPVRVGAHQQLNPGLVRHQHSSSSVENGSRRMASAEGMGLPALLLITLLISLAFSLHPTEIPFYPTVKRSSRTSSQTTSTFAVHSPQDHQRRQCPYSSPAALSQFSYSSTSSPNGFTLFFPFSSSFLSTTFASKTFHSKSRHT